MTFHNSESDSHRADSRANIAIGQFTTKVSNAVHDLNAALLSADRVDNLVNEDNAAVGANSPDLHGNIPISQIPIDSVKFLHHVPNISRISKDAIFAHINGNSIRLKPGPKILPSSGPILDCCLVAPNKILVLFSNNVMEIYGYNLGVMPKPFNPNPLFRLPCPRLMPVPQLQSVMVCDKLYVVTDAVSMCIYSWNPRTAEWQHPINVSTYCSSSSTFQMAAFADRLFLGLSDHVCCVNSKGVETWWSANCVRHPGSGIAADCTGVYVFDTGQNELGPAIVILAITDGSVLKRILPGVFRNPSSLAVGDGTVVVSEGNTVSVYSNTV